MTPRTLTEWIRDYQSQAAQDFHHAWSPDNDASEDEIRDELWESTIENIQDNALDSELEALTPEGQNAIANAYADTYIALVRESRAQDACTCGTNGDGDCRSLGCDPECPDPNCG